MRCSPGKSIKSLLPIGRVLLAASLVFPVAAQASEPTERQERRAFYTAPPVIPHETHTEDYKDCMGCHTESLRMTSGEASMQTPHPYLTSCQQCHVASEHYLFPEEKVSDFDTWWVGLPEPRRGTRAHILAPPTIPHRVKMRENCLSCHAPDHPNRRLRTPHPERTQCMQCHVGNPLHEFLVEDHP